MLPPDLANGFTTPFVKSLSSARKSATPRLSIKIREFVSNPGSLY